MSVRNLHVVGGLEIERQCEGDLVDLLECGMRVQPLGDLVGGTDEIDLEHHPGRPLWPRGAGQPGLRVSPVFRALLVNRCEIDLLRGSDPACSAGRPWRPVGGIWSRGSITDWRKGHLGWLAGAPAGPFALARSMRTDTPELLGGVVHTGPGNYINDGRPYRACVMTSGPVERRTDRNSTTRGGQRHP